MYKIIIIRIKHAPFAQIYADVDFDDKTVS